MSKTNLSSGKNSNPHPSKIKALKSWEKLLIDIGPIAVFMIGYNILKKYIPDEALFMATGLLMITTVLAVFYSWIRTKKLAMMPLITGIFVVLLGGLTLIFHKSVFIKMKPTFIYLFLALFILGSLLLKRNAIKFLLNKQIRLKEKAWNPLAYSWIIWFFMLAILNEFVWRNFTESQWVNFKFWIVIPLSFLFTLLQIPYMMKYMEKSPDKIEN